MSGDFIVTKRQTSMKALIGTGRVELRVVSVSSINTIVLKVFVRRWDMLLALC